MFFFFYISVYSYGDFHGENYPVSLSLKTWGGRTGKLSEVSLPSKVVATFGCSTFFYLNYLVKMFYSSFNISAPRKKLRKVYNVTYL